MMKAFPSSETRKDLSPSAATRRRRAIDDQVEGQGGCDDDGGGRGAQEAWGVAIPGKLPPERLAVLHMPIGEESEQGGGTESDDDERKPGLRRPEGAPVAFAMEGAGIGLKQAGKEHEDQGILPVESFRERKHSPCKQQADGHHACERDAVVQAAGNDDQQQAGEAGEQMRSLRKRQRQEMAEKSVAIADRRGHAGNEQGHAPGKHEHRGNGWYDQPREFDCACRCRPEADLDICRDEQQEADRRNAQWYEVVNDAEYEKGGDCLGTRSGSQAEKNGRFEDAESAGRMADDSRNGRQHEDRQERRVAWHEIRGQQKVEAGCGGTDIDGADQNLGNRNLWGWQREAPAKN